MPDAGMNEGTIKKEHLSAILSELLKPKSNPSLPQMEESTSKVVVLSPESYTRVLAHQMGKALGDEMRADPIQASKQQEPQRRDQVGDLSQTQDRAQINAQRGLDKRQVVESKDLGTEPKVKDIFTQTDSDSEEEKKKKKMSYWVRFKEMFLKEKDISSMTKEEFLKSIAENKENKPSQEMENRILRGILDKQMIGIFSYENHQRVSKELDLANLDPKQGTVFMSGEAAREFHKIAGQMDEKSIYKYAEELSRKFPKETFLYKGPDDKSKLQDFLLREKCKQLADDLGNRAKHELDKNKEEKDKGMLAFRRRKIDTNLEYREKLLNLARSDKEGILNEFNDLSVSYLRDRNELRKFAQNIGAKDGDEFNARIQKVDKGLTLNR